MKKRPGNPTVQCTVCRHSERHRIELMLAGGASAAAVARKFNISHHAAGRHLNNHVSAERRAQLVAGPLKLSELAEKAAEADLALIDYLAIVRTALLEQFMQANEAGDRSGGAMLAGRLTDVLRLMGSVSGEIAKATTTIQNNTLILSSPLFADLQAMLIQRLTPFPDALCAVVEGLEQLGAGVRGSAPARPILEHQPEVA